MLRVSIAALGRLFRSRARNASLVTEEQEMGFFEHLEEFRRMLIHCILAFALAMIFAFCFSKQIFAFMRGPLEKAAQHEIVVSATQPETAPPADPVAVITDIASLLLYGENPGNSATATATAGTLSPATDALATLKFMDVFSILLNIGMIGGLALSSPFVLYFASRFIAPALTEREKKCILPFCGAAMLLFCGGCLFSFFWLIPISIEVMHHFNQMFGLKLTWIASDYYGFVSMMTLLVGVAFQFPLIVIVLQYLEIIKTSTLLRVWRHVLVGIMIGSLLITPLGDPVSLSVLTGILFIFYLLAVSVGGLLVRAKQRRQAREESEYEKSYRLTHRRDQETPDDTARPPEQPTTTPSPTTPSPSSRKGDLEVLDPD